ncbi:cytochrome P460 [Leptobacterium flavescens]|uniref:Cytochrome P460 n=1 Tax=Leptobacterium flavescens TaxID=472055 RepID=A0A6P0UL52_9FLAO|nr:cytochrome P460 family protein [Leptobacterium flavescens]NER12609.1 cytochrome P460 [Leptobacterium flavescens]
MKNKFLGLLVPLVLVFSLVSFNAFDRDEEEYQQASFFKIDSKGELVRPTNYRSWVYVGSPLTPNDLNNGKAAFPEFHNVYIDPVSYKHYKKTGKWRDGTILIKELVSVGGKAAASGNGYFMGDFIGLEATIKSKKHFSKEPGNWAYFSFTNPKGGTLANTSKPFETTQCNSCHNANAADDFVFTQHYPVLRAAKNVGENTVPENSGKR